MKICFLSGPSVRFTTGDDISAYGARRVRARDPMQWNSSLEQRKLRWRRTRGAMNSLPVSAPDLAEADHLYRCAAGGQIIDYRSLGDVLTLEEPRNGLSRGRRPPGYARRCGWELISSRLRRCSAMRPRRASSHFWINANLSFHCRRSRTSFAPADELGRSPDLCERADISERLCALTRCQSCFFTSTSVAVWLSTRRAPRWRTSPMLMVWRSGQRVRS